MGAIYFFAFRARRGRRGRTSRSSGWTTYPSGYAACSLPGLYIGTMRTGFISLRARAEQFRG
jgi:hypothetical protein